MIKITFVASDGERREVEIEEGETAREAALYNDVPGIDGDCGGVCACATCHVHVDPNGSTRWVGLCTMEWRPTSCSSPKAPPNTVALPADPMKPMLDGLVLHLPEQQYRRRDPRPRSLHSYLSFRSRETPMATTEPATQTDEDGPRVAFRRTIFPPTRAVNALAADGPTNETPAQTKWREAVGARGRHPHLAGEYGGGGLTKAEQIIDQEGPAVPTTRSAAWACDVRPDAARIRQRGTEAGAYPPICRGETAGARAIGTQCRLRPREPPDFAEDKGDHYLVNGQKTWTSGGQWPAGAGNCTNRQERQAQGHQLHADRHDPSKSARSRISGTSPFCETFFTDVKVPRKTSSAKAGWTIGKRLLQHERTNIGGAACPPGARASAISPRSTSRRRRRRTRRCGAARQDR